MTFVSTEYGPEQLNLVVDQTTPVHAETMAVSGWSIVEETREFGVFRTEGTSATGGAEQFAQFDYRFHVRRKLGYYVFRVIVPLTFIVLMSWAVFWIDPDMAGVQMGLAATSILTLIAFLFSLNAILPRLPYLTRMDVFLFASLAMVFFAFAEAVATAVLTKADRDKLALRIDRAARWVFPMTGFSFKNEGSPEVRRREDGFNDVSIGAKWALVDEQGRRPAVSLLGDLSFPVGDAEFTDDFVNPKLLLLFSRTLALLSLTYNVGPSFIRLEKEGRERTVVDLPYTLMLSGPVADGAGWFAELFGAFALSDARTDRHSAQAGITYLVGPSFQLDVRAGLGLVENVPDWLVGAGIGVRLPHLIASVRF